MNNSNFPKNKKIVKRPKPVEPEPVIEKKEEPKPTLNIPGKKLVKKSPTPVVANPRVLQDEEPVVEVVEKEEVQEPVVEEQQEPVTEEVEESTASNVMVFAPISRKKHHYDDEPIPVHSAKTPTGNVYALDEKGLQTLIDIIASALAEKFVSKDEIETVVEHTLQKMVIANNVQQQVPESPVPKKKNTAKPVK